MSSDEEPKNAKWMNKNMRKKFLVFFALNDQGVACYKDKPFTTSAGVCVAPSLKGKNTKVG